MYKHFHHIANSTTSLVGYIGLLIIAGSYLGGAPGIGAQSLKGSLSEYGMRKIGRMTDNRFVTVRIDGREYRAELLSIPTSTTGYDTIESYMTY